MRQTTRATGLIGAPLVYVVDDHASTRDALQALFESVSLESRLFASAEEFLDVVTNERPGCVLVDMRMPGMSGLELQKALHDQQCHLPIIFLSGYGNVESAVHAMQQGADDFLNKPADDETLLAKVKNAIRSDQERRRSQREHDTLVARLNNLTGREFEVLEAVVQGLSNKGIARKLGISPKTVELHRAHMMQKMHAQSIAEAVRMYMNAMDDPDTSGPDL